jgi:predicted nucleic acid-binding protein
MLLLDASVWAILGEPGNRYHADARALVEDLSRPMAALDLTMYEIANVAARKKGRPADASRLARLLLTRCEDRLVGIDVELFDAAVGIVAEHGLTAYDAAYVAAARRYGMALVSADIADLVSKGFAVTPDAALYP